MNEAQLFMPIKIFCRKLFILVNSSQVICLPVSENQTLHTVLTLLTQHYE